MLKIYPMILGPVQTTCYVVSNGLVALVVDPADTGKKIFEYLKSQKLTLKAILITHGHFDHIGGVNELASLCNVPIYAHKLEKEYFDKPDVNLSTMMYQQLVLDKTLDIQFIQDEQTLNFLGQTIVAKHVPGHTSGSLCYYFKEAACVFTGDTLFEKAIGRTDFIHGNHEQLVRKISEKLMTLPKQTLVYPGHGACTTIESEAQSNPFL